MSMKLGAILALLAGLAIAVFVLMHIGIAPVLQAVAAVGFVGFAVILIFGTVEVVLPGVAWQVLLPGQGGWLLFSYARQARDSARDILPLTQFGGFVVGARALMLGGVRSADAFASTIVDVTTELMAQIPFILFGVLVLLTRLRESDALSPYIDGIVLATMLLIPATVAFVVLQKRGSAMAAKLAEKFTPAAVRGAQSFADAMDRLYANPKALAWSSSLHLLGWLASGVWLWIIIRMIGFEVSLIDALAIESLMTALRSLAFFVPAALGVQEAGYAALAPLLGLGPEVGVAVSLLRRARDIAVGVPVLLFWQAMEARRALAAGAGGAG